MPSVEVNLPNVPQGASVSVPYLGKFKNGETTEVSDLRWGRYLRNHPGARDSEDGVLRLTREAMQEQNDPDESHEGTEPPPGENPTEHSPEQTEGDSLEKPVKDRGFHDHNEEATLIDPSEEG